MTIDLSKARIFLHPETTDMRKAVNGLTAIVQENMRQDPFNGSVCLFCIQAGQSGRKTHRRHHSAGTVGRLFPVLARRKQTPEGKRNS